MMEYKTVRSFFMRFNKVALFKICNDNELAEKIKKTGTKDVLCRLLVEHTISGKIPLKSLEILDLLHCYGSKNRKWDVYKLIEKGKDKQVELNDPEVFETLFEKELKTYLNCRVCVSTRDNMLLTRISVWNGNINILLSPTSIYMFHIPGSSYVLFSTVKAAYKKYVFKAVENLFSCETLMETDLSGKNVDSLYDLVLNKDSQGSFSLYRKNQVQDNPLSRKRKRDAGEDNDVEKNPINTFNEQWRIDQKSKAQTLKTFGSNPQPSLEKIEFKMNTRFKAGEYVPELADNEDTVNCFVRFKGPNVLEGIKQLCEHGLASQPLPSHIRNIHSLSRNYFILTDKKRAKQD